MDEPSSGLPAAGAADTDAPTEAYVGIAVDPSPPEPPSDGAGSGPPRRRPSRRGAALSALGILFVAGLGAWGATSSGALTTHRASLATSQTELAAAHTSLDSTRDTLDTKKAS